ncbi:7664_t:CDS:1, partial [Paraglomus brasilianum]
WTHKETQATTSGASVTSGPITLFYLVYGDSIEKAFKVVIEKDKDVNDLKIAIKEKRQSMLHNIDTADLVLWRVNIPTHEKTKVELLKSSEADIEKDLGGVKIVDPTADISEEFGALPPKKHIHVIIMRLP